MALHHLKHILLATPFVLITIAPFIAIANWLTISLDPKLVALGALGWWIALLLRAPVMLLARRLPQQKASRLVVLASGSAEEIIRLILLLILGLTTQNAYSVGLGWAAIEILYSLVQGFGMAVLAQKRDAKALEAKKLLKAMGMERAMQPSAVYWGIVERLGANALHISFALLLVVSPYLVLATATLHSLANFGITKLMKRSLAAAELLFLGLGAGLFLAALVLVPR
ncbi:hypothetical protein JNJ66_01120 [Candidatus Saccharibacteria bacterium]|nr:hypothetical protein [Candidatus Saccharibacteria bacterium]